MTCKTYQDYDVVVTTVARYRVVATDKEHASELGIKDASNRVAWDECESIRATDVSRVPDKIYGAPV